MQWLWNDMKMTGKWVFSLFWRNKCNGMYVLSLWLPVVYFRLKYVKIIVLLDLNWFVFEFVDSKAANNEAECDRLAGRDQLSGRCRWPQTQVPTTWPYPWPSQLSTPLTQTSSRMIDLLGEISYREYAVDLKHRYQHPDPTPDPPNSLFQNPQQNMFDLLEEISY